MPSRSRGSRWLGDQYEAFMTLRGDAEDSAERSPAAMRCVKSRLPVPPPDPGGWGARGVPPRRPPPYPYGETGSMNVSDATGRAIANAAMAAPPVDQPAR